MITFCDPKDDIGARCAFGRHRTDARNPPMYAVDGRPICFNHVVELLDYFNLARNGASYKQIVRTQNEMHKERAKREFAGGIRAKRDPGFVYYIEIGEHIKIGYAKDIARRMRAYPPSARLLAAHPGTPELEHEMHLKFRGLLDRGREWFRQSPMLMTHIAEVREQFGDPSVMAYAFTRPAEP